MNEKIKSGEDEYHFSDLDTGDIYGTPQVDPEKLDRFKKLRRIILVFGVLAMIFAVYQLSTLFRAKPKTESAEQPPITTQPTAVVPSVDSAVQSAEVDKSLAGLQVSETATRSSVQEVITEMAKLRTEMDDLRSAVSGMRSSMQNLSEEMREQVALLSRQQQMIEALSKQQTQPKKPDTPKKVIKKVLPPQPLYYIEAMVPGRAWLKRTDGTTLTISVGDRLQSYDGVVARIDPITGQVLMSSGRMITYRPDDR